MKLKSVESNLRMGIDQTEDVNGGELIGKENGIEWDEMKREIDADET